MIELTIESKHHDETFRAVTQHADVNSVRAHLLDYARRNKAQICGDYVSGGELVSEIIEDAAYWLVDVDNDEDFLPGEADL